jgi:ribosome-associated protein
MTLEPVQVVKLAWQGADEKKALSPVILDMKNLTIVADYFLIASGRTAIAVRAIAEGISDRLAADAQLLPKGREGYEDAHWILLDYGAVVVHVFLEQDREYYNLERLWADAPRVEMEADVSSVGENL